jgi:hypothetical protein
LDSLRELRGVLDAGTQTDRTSSAPSVRIPPASGMQGRNEGSGKS